MKEEKVYLYGRHALKEALLSNKNILKKVFLSTSASESKEVRTLLEHESVSWSLMKGDSKLGEDAVHQGVIAEIDTAALYQSLEVILAQLQGVKNPLVVILDELHDPHNVGAIIRSAVAFGARAIIMPEHNQAPITGTVIKTSAGMALRIPIVRVGNINQTVRILKDAGFWIYGLVMDGDTSLQKAVFDTSTAIIVGNESDGIRQKTRELCDVGLSIPMEEGCESLNASVAASVALYEHYRSTHK